MASKYYQIWHWRTGNPLNDLNLYNIPFNQTDVDIILIDPIHIPKLIEHFDVMVNHPKNNLNPIMIYIDHKQYKFVQR